MVHVHRHRLFLRRRYLRPLFDHLLDRVRPELHEKLLAGFQRGPHFKFLRLDEPYGKHR